MKMEVEIVSIEAIKPYHRNPRKNEIAVDKVAQSITDYGFNVPITVDKKGVIVTGHTRYQAARRLELREVPIVRLNLTKRQATEYRIADNKTQEFSKWDKDALLDELRLVGDLSTFQNFFVEDLGEMLNVSVMPMSDKVTTEIIETQTEISQTVFDDSNNQTEDMIEIPCPHCGESSFISKGDMLSLLGIKG